MKFDKTIFGLTVCTVLMATAATRSHAWSVKVGNPTPPCCTATGTTANGGQFTLNTDVYYSQDTGLFTYRYDLKNISDTAGLSGLAVGVGGASDFGTSGLKFFTGFGPTNGSALHDSPIGYDNSSTEVYTGDIGEDLHPHTIGAYAQGNYVTFTDVAMTKSGAPKPILVGQSNSTEFTQSPWGGEYFFIQSKSGPAQDDMEIFEQGSSTAYHITSCGPGGYKPQGSPMPTPEPGSVLPFALGGLGLLGLAIRARRAHA